MSSSFAVSCILQPLYLFASLFGISSALRRSGFSTTYSLSMALVGVAIFSLAMGAFQFWAPGSRVIPVLQWASVALSAALFFIAVIRNSRDEVLVPISFAFVMTLLLLTWAFFGVGDTPILDAAANRWTHPLPGDNIIPMNFAKALLAGDMPKGLNSVYFGDWQSSDRPPLQAVMFLQMPGTLLRGATPTNYQPAAVALQMTVLIAVWAMARSLGSGVYFALLCSAAVFFTPLTLVNGVFVWPKLLGTTFVLLAAVIQFGPQRNWLSGAVVGALAGMAMLSHGTSAFAIAGIAIAAALTGKTGDIKTIGAATAAFVLIYAPWAGYIAFVDPPGDRLLKWHLAGVTNIDPRSFKETFIQSYERLSWPDIWAVRDVNIKTILKSGFAELTKVKEVYDTSGWKAAAASLRINQFFYFVLGTGLLGYAIFVLPAALLRRETLPFAAAIIATLIFWVVVLFQPSATVIHVGSLFPEIALVVVALCFVHRFSPATASVLALSHIATTAIVYTL